MANFIPTSNVSTATTLSAGEFAIIGSRIIVGGAFTPTISTGSNCHIDNMGTILGRHAVYFGGTSFLYNQESGTISASVVAVAGIGIGSTVNNMGTIFGGAIAVELDQGGTLINSGSLTVGYEATGSAFNSVIFFAGSQAGTVQNSGVIKTMLADSFAIQDIGTGSDTITNTGTIIGKVALGDGDDVFNSSAGKIVGQIDGQAGGDTLTGSVAGDTILGDTGSDTLNGKAGNDKLTGGADGDIFVFNTKLNATTNRDVITDFTHADDTIQLENAIFAGMGSGALKAKFFHAGTKAADGNDHIIYNETTGALYYDSDGTGSHAQVKFATIGNHAAAGLAFDDFVLV